MMVCTIEAANIIAATAKPSTALGPSVSEYLEAWYDEMYAKSQRRSWGCRNARASWTSLRTSAKAYGPP